MIAELAIIAKYIMRGTESCLMYLCIKTKANKAATSLNSGWLSRLNVVRKIKCIDESHTIKEAQDKKINNFFKETHQIY